MDLYIMRHGIAEDRADGHVRGDAGRSLTRKGIKRVRGVASELKNRGVDFDLILASPLRRAQETASVVADVFGSAGIVQTSTHLKIGGMHSRLIEELREHFGNYKSILLVGHEPSLSALISLLLTGGGHAAVTIKKGGVCKLTINRLRDGKCATMEWLMTPAMMLPPT
jgi:phosphohistidine phosphatase